MTTARRRASTAAMHAVRCVLIERSEGRCDVCSWPLDASDTGYLFEAHHRLSRARGGDDSPANLMCCHPLCHQAVHSRVSRSTVNGWILPSGSVPEEVSVSLRGDAALFTADGGVLWIGPTESKSATATSNAWFDSHCPNCGRPILARDQIGLVEGEWLCSGCYDTDNADDPDSYRALLVDAELGVR